jgi:hypothetical protein
VMNMPDETVLGRLFMGEAIGTADRETKIK